MRTLKQLFIVMSAILCVGCSPQKRLALLLTQYPELRRDSSLVVGKDIILPADSASVDFTIEELSGLASETDSPEQSRTRHNDLTVATMSGAIATISVADKTDRYRLIVKTKIDTIRLRDTITVPAYTTRVEYKDKIVNKMNNAQSFFFWCGIIMMVMIAIIIMIRIIVRFVKV